MLVEEQKKLSQSWWFHGHNNNQKTSPCFNQLFLEKTTAMLKLIEEDADSFAQRAEMYYKKRAELINMVEDFYKTHRSLAERFDLLKSEPKNRLITSLSAPIPFNYQPNKLPQSQEKCYDSYSEDAFESDMSAESEVDDPEEEEMALVHKRVEDRGKVCGESKVDEPEEIEVNQVRKGENEQVLSVDVNEIEEVKKLREEIEKLKEENKVQQEQLREKDEEKRESKVTESSSKKKNQFEFNTFKGLFSGKLFNGPSKSKITTIVAL
ncbi:hypothetical protein MKX01_016239 [Papaver californicum]|nr:hypothetical protein MKX01_016239 [Papaver californicum]